MGQDTPGPSCGLSSRRAIQGNGLEVSLCRILLTRRVLPGSQLRSTSELLHSVRGISAVTFLRDCSLLCKMEVIAFNYFIAR